MPSKFTLNPRAMTVTEYAAKVGVHRQAVVRWVAVGCYDLGPLPATRTKGTGKGAVNRWGYRYEIDEAAADAWNKARLAIKRAKRRNHRKTHGKAFGL